MFFKISTLALIALCWSRVRCEDIDIQDLPASEINCYNTEGRAQRCSPPFENAAFKSDVDVTNTCGDDGPEEYCRQTGAAGEGKVCEICEKDSFPPRYLTDFNNRQNPTWWQSSTMMQGIQWPNSVNLSIHLGKSYEITYVRLRFHSSQPESFAIYKKTKMDGAWVPYEFYSTTCQETYNLPQNGLVRNDDDVICRDEYTNISPTSGAAAPFSTLEGRPGAYNFDESSILQEWVLATDIRIVLNKLNTFGDELFRDPMVLRSYFYAISDIAIGGRCHCNGHASQCVDRRCVCEHNTDGIDCDRCLPFFNDRPWKKATTHDAHECMRCDCNGLSEKCFFDKTLLDRTGRGGHCTDCRENSAGPRCEDCQIGFYKNREGRCAPCNCNPTGSRNQQCINGVCQCKPGVTGERCDKCLPNYFGFGPSGCRTCECHLAGSYNNNPECVTATGTCRCKDYVQGQNCDECKPGFFGLNAEDPLGCTPCFCFGHSDRCSLAPGYSVQVVESDFRSGLQGWTGVTESEEVIPLDINFVAGAAGISAPPHETVYFKAPDRYLGDQKMSYNLFLTFDLRTGGEENDPTSQNGIIIEGNNGRQIYMSITSQNNPAPRLVNHNYKFRLNEHPAYGWTPTLSGYDFISVLSDIRAIKIRGSYSYQGVGFIDNVKLQIASGGAGRTPALNVERCECPEGYVGQFCESCAPGFMREPNCPGPFAQCIPCNCFGHSDDCEPSHGACICQHNTAGTNCQECAPGYYGDAQAGTPNDCKPCPCPNQGECIELANGEVTCTECQVGYAGNRCEECADGYFGDPEGRGGQRRSCQKCECNDNIDPNAIGNCDRYNGQCLKCIHNTAGFNCEECLPGHYGNALVYPKGQCQPCNCYPPGTHPQAMHTCNAHTGQCYCKPNFYGMKCDQCLDGHWNANGGGCERCDCDRTGSTGTTCDPRTGQCPCKPGVAGKRCDSCAQNHYGFSMSGCLACNCHPDGSADDRCDPNSGRCSCRQGIEGRTCDRCAENRFLRNGHCIECPECYKLVQLSAEQVRAKVDDLRVFINYIANNDFRPTADEEFRRSLHFVNQTVVNMYWIVRRHGSNGGPPGSDQLTAVQTAIQDLFRIITTIHSNFDTARQHGDQAGLEVKLADDLLNELERKLYETEVKVNNEGRILLSRAFEAQQRLGHKSNTLTRMAHEARMLVENQERDISSIENILREALSLAEEAQRLAEHVVGRSNGIDTDIINIKYKLTTLNELKLRVDRDSRNSLENAMRVYNESWSLLVEISSIHIPMCNSSIEEYLNRFRQRADILEREVQRYEEENRRLVNTIHNLVRTGEHSYHKAVSEQQILDELLANADAIKGDAESSILRCIRVYEEARNMLRTLEEFDSDIRRSKELAEEALKKKYIIIEQIREAQLRTRQAHENIADADRDAKLAKTNADMARHLADDALATLESILRETSTAREKITDIKEESVKLTVKIEDVEKRLTSLETTAADDAKSIAEARDKTDYARSRALTVSDKLMTASSSINSILDDLGKMEGLDVRSLDELELRLSRAEEELKSLTNFENLDQLKEFDYQITISIEDYNSQLLQFHADIENIRHINATIPRRCFRVISLEPVDRR